MPVEEGSCNGNVNGDDWVNPDEPDGNESGDNGNETDNGGDESDNGDDDGSNNEVADLIEDALLAGSEARNIVAGASDTLVSIRSNYADFNMEFEKAADADQKVLGAMGASEEYLVLAKEAIYGPADEGTMVMEEDCSASEKILDFNKKIGAEMRTVNA